MEVGVGGTGRAVMDATPFPMWRLGIIVWRLGIMGGSLSDPPAPRLSAPRKVGEEGNAPSR